MCAAAASSGGACNPLASAKSRGQPCKSVRSAPWLAASCAPPGAGPAKPGGGGAAKRKKVWKSGEVVVAQEAAAAAAGQRELVNVKLAADGSNLPGWAPRPVAPYAPAPAPAAGATLPPLPGAVVVCTDSLLGFDLASLGGGFCGVLLNLPLQHGPPAAAAAPAAPAIAGGAPAGCPRAVTLAQLARLRLDNSVLAAGILCAWADKEHVAPVVRCFGGWGAAYVENLTWAQLSASGNILQVCRAAARAEPRARLLLGLAPFTRPPAVPVPTLPHPALAPLARRAALPSPDKHAHACAAGAGAVPPPLPLHAAHGAQGGSQRD